MGSETSQRIGWVGVRLVFLLFFNLKGSNKVTLGTRDFSGAVSGFCQVPREKSFADI